MSSHYKGNTFKKWFKLKKLIENLIEFGLDNFVQNSIEYKYFQDNFTFEFTSFSYLDFRRKISRIKLF